MIATLKDIPDAALIELLNIVCSLSPENLAADGERSRTQIAARHAVLMKQLKALQASTGLPDAEVDESAVYAEWEVRGRPRETASR